MAVMISSLIAVTQMLQPLPQSIPSPNEAPQTAETMELGKKLFFHPPSNLKLPPAERTAE